MTFMRVSPICLFLCLVAPVHSANAQNQASPASAGYIGDSTGFATAGDFSGSYLFGNDGGTYFLFDKLVGDGPGFSAGYSRFGIRAKLFDNGDSHLWGAGYALITDDTRVGVNVGGGYRWLYDSNIIGVHGWFDSYETNNGNRYDQVTAGFELLHEDVDFRVNGYYPINETETFIGVTDPGSVSTFTDRGIGFFGRGLDEQALKGVDLEVGTAIFAVNWARIYGGGYWYDGKNTSFGGARGRIETSISPDLSLNFMVQNDTEFNTNYNVGIEYRFSGGLSPGLCTPFHGENRKYNAVRRQWPIATQVVDVATIVPMLNPKTGGAVSATFVDNSNPNAGDGSFDNPFKSLPSSDNADFVLVFAGSPNTATTGNITLRPNQQLLGEGKRYTFNDTLRGQVQLPEVFNINGPAPILVAQNPAQNVVTLSDWNRVANFDIRGAARAGIGGMNIEDFEIDMVRTFQGGANPNDRPTDGINIVNASGTGIIRNSGFHALDEGIFVSNVDGGPLNLRIEGGQGVPTVGVVTAAGGNNGVHVAADGADINLVLDGIRTDDTAGRGVFLEASLGGTLSANVDDAGIRNTNGLTGTGFELNVDSGGTINTNMTNISAKGNDDLFVVNVRDGQFNGFVAGAVFERSTTGSGVRLNLDDATGRLDFVSLFSNGNAVDGVEVAAAGDGTNFFVGVVDSQISANMHDGFDTDVTDGANLRYFVDPTFAMQNFENGFEYNVEGPGSVFVADIIQTTFEDSGVNAVDGRVFNGGYANVDLVGSEGVSAGSTGYALEVGRNSTFVGTITDGLFNLAGDSGLDIAVTDNSNASLIVSSTEARNNGDFGLRYLVEDGVRGPSSLFLSVADGDLTANGDSNISGTVRGDGSQASVYLTNVIADGGASNGAVVVAAENGGINNVTWAGGSASQSANTGIIANVDGVGSQVRLNLTDVRVVTNVGDGINGTLTNGGAGSLLNISLTNSSIFNNQQSGVVVSADGAGALSNVLFNSTPVTGNFNGDGFRFDITGGAGLLALANGDGSSFSGNGESGWDGSVSGAGSFANLTVDGANSNLSGLQGGIFDVTAGGLLNLNLSNLSISQSQLDGLLITSDGAGSRANVVMDQVLMTQNGLSLSGDGFDARATNGGRIDATLSNLMVTENREDAFRYDASTGGVITTRMDTIVADSNGRHGLEYHASSGGQFSALVTTASFSNEGGPFVGDGVFGTADGAGSVASGIFQGVMADNNNRMGFEFNATGGATLLADIRSNSQFGNSSGSGNAINGVRFNAADAGTMAFLKMMGPNTFNGNGADGINYDAVGVNMAVANVTGTISNNGMDGINIRMINVLQGAIDLDGEGTGSITGNVGDGIDITTQNVSLVNKTVNGMMIDAFSIDGFTISGNGGEPIVINMTGTSIQDGSINGNTINGGVDGINVSLENGDGDLVIDGNNISNAQRYGIAVTSGSGTHQVKITNNTVISSGDTNIFVDLFGTTQTGLMINDNMVLGGGLGQALFTTGLNFTGATFDESGMTPPDIAGAVGPDHIVELVNGAYTVYDKTTGAQLFQSSLDNFFTAAGLPQGAGGTRMAPRLIYDPSTNRWFATAIDDGAANMIYVAVSNTNNPLDGFQGVSFVGDTVDGTRFNGFDSLGIDATGLYIATSNSIDDVFTDVSIFSIPKTDLLAATPTVTNLTRFENLDPTMFGTSLQPAVDFGGVEVNTEILGTGGLFTGNNLVLTNLTATATPTAMIGTPNNVPVTSYIVAPDGRQPAAPRIDNVSPGITSNVVEVNDSLWAVHSISGTSGNAAIRWYEIDSATGNVLQSGVIQDPNVDYQDASIAVNASGVVVIGFTGTGPTQNPSSMAAFGTTDTTSGLTSFQMPQILQAGNDSYFLADDNGVNAWGRYSSTVVDPNDSDTFWTFQEYALDSQTWAVQVTEIGFTQAVLGDTANDGIHVNVRDNATMLDSMINGNTVSDHGGDGIEVIVADMADVDNLMIDGNNVTGNDGDGIRFENTGTGTLDSLSVSNNMGVSGNGGDGIDIIVDGLGGAPDLNVDGNMVDGNTGRGIAISAVDTAVGDISVSMNTVSDNTGGNGVTLDLANSNVGALPVGDITLVSNTVTGSGGDGMLINLMNRSGIDTLAVVDSTINSSTGGGLIIRAEDTPITNLLLDGNTTASNMGGDGVLLDLLNTPVDTLTITNSGSAENAGDGIDLNLDGSPIGTLNISGNNQGGTTSAIGLTFIIDGNTFADPFMITNSSSAGNQITAFMLDVTTAVLNPAGQVIFDTEDTGSPVAFQPLANSDVITGLQTVNGVQITQGTNPLQDSMGTVLPGGGVPDNSQVFDLTFNDFNSMETFQWELDLDFITQPASTVFGSDLIGSTIRVDFSGGQFLTGNLQPITGNAFGSTFVATGGTLSAPGIFGNAENGLRINASNGSDIGEFTLDDNVIDGNGMNGVELIVNDSTLPPVGGTGIVSNNEFTNNDGDGFRLINPDTNGNEFELNFTDNTASTNTGVGINIELNSDSGGMTTTATGNTISDNSSIGASFVVQGDATLDLTFGDTDMAANVVSGNVDAGVAVKTKDMSVATIVVENTMVSGTIDGPNAAFDGDGLAVQSSGNSIVTSLTIGDDTVENTSFNTNAGNGIDIQVSDNARNPNITIQNVTTTGNGMNGIGFTRTGFGAFSEDLDSDGVMDAGEDVNGDGMAGNAVITMVTSDGNTGNGLDVNISGSQMPVQRIDVDQSSFSNNTTGMNFIVNNDAVLLVNATNNLINNNVANGVNVVTNQNSAFGNIVPAAGNPNSPMAVPSVFRSNVVSNNGGDGFNFVANGSSVQVIDVDDLGDSNDSTGTSATVIDSNGGNGVEVTGNGSSQQNIDLVGVQITNTDGVDTGNGVDINANDTSTVNVEISGGINGPAILGARIAHVSIPGLGGTGVANGIDALVTGQAILNLDVQDVSLFNNTGDAIHIENIGPTVTGNQAGGSGQRQTIQATFDNVDARLSGDQGLDVLLTGNVGGRPIAQGDTDQPVLIDVMNSNFSSNANEGIFFRAQPGFTHGGDNLYADLIAEFNVMDSIIQSNGSTSISDGLVIEIGTNAYVLSEISGNTFGANGRDDFHTRAFESGPDPNTAQLDLAFQQNSGDHIRPTAFFFDPEGSDTVDPTPVGAALFILDNAFTVEPNNFFQMFGVQQMEVFGPDGFQTNGYILRAAANHGTPTFP